MRHVTRVMTAALLGALALAAASVALGPSVGAQAEQKTLVSGWYQDRAVEYYDFGTNTPLASNGAVPTQPIWVFIHGMNADGSPDLVEGQHNIIDLVPGEPGYSDLWQVILVTVPADYEPDSIRSAQEVIDSGFDTQTTDMFVNCPIVPEGTTLETGQELTQGWNDGEAVFYPDFGANPPDADPIWVFIHGMNADGTPDFVEGQSNIIDTVPGDADYTAFWQVNLVTVPADYEPNSIRSAEDVMTSGFEITATDMLVNCPVVSVASAPGQQPTGAPVTGTGFDSGSDAFPYWLMGLLAAAGLLATGGALAYARMRR